MFTGGGVRPDVSRTSACEHDQISGQCLQAVASQCTRHGREAQVWLITVLAFSLVYASCKRIPSVEQALQESC